MHDLNQRMPDIEQTISSINRARDPRPSRRSSDDEGSQPVSLEEQARKKSLQPTEEASDTAISPSTKAARIADRPVFESGAPLASLDCIF